MFDVRIFELKNGRKYRVTNTNSPYVNDEYPSGGFAIHVWADNFKNPQWIFVDHSPNEETVQNFLKSAERLIPEKELKKSQ
jgi:hypothetical protein